MIVDVHGHISPPESLKRFPMPPALGDVEGMIERKLAAGIETTIVGSPVGAGAMVPIPGTDNYAQTASQLAAFHDWLAGTCAEHPKRLKAYVYTDPFGGDELLGAAAETLQGDDAFVGFIVNTSVRGEFLGSERSDQFFAMAAQLHAPVMVHPPADPAAGAGLRDLRLVEQVARFCDVTTALARCLLGGWLERYPDLNLIGATAGGAIALLAEKLDLAVAGRHWKPPGGRPAGASTGSLFGPPGGLEVPPALAKPPSESLRRIWVDTATPSAASLRANLDAIGPDRMLFGTDSPPLTSDLRGPLGAVESLPLCERQQAQILGANACRLFGLPGTGALPEHDASAVPL
jgi:predicted TIM-barrel fold metal-dependent hydrolase